MYTVGRTGQKVSSGIHLSPSLFVFLLPLHILTHERRRLRAQVSSFSSVSLSLSLSLHAATTKHHRHHHQCHRPSAMQCGGEGVAGLRSQETYARIHRHRQRKLNCYEEYVHKYSKQQSIKQNYLSIENRKMASARRLCLWEGRCPPLPYETPRARELRLRKRLFGVKKRGRQIKKPSFL